MFKSGDMFVTKGDRPETTLPVIQDIQGDGSPPGSPGSAGPVVAAARSPPLPGLWWGHSRPVVLLAVLVGGQQGIQAIKLLAVATVGV